MEARCIACGSVRPSLFLSKNGYDILRCPECSLFFVHPIPAPHEVAALYRGGDRAAFKPRGSRWRAFDRRMIARWIRRRTGGGRMLEIGCNQGDLLIAAEKIGRFEPIGLDLDAPAISYAHERGASVVLGSLEAAPFPPETFEVLVAWHVLEHLCDPIEGLLKIKELLRPGGWLVACFPSPAHPKGKLAGKRWHYYNPPTHLWYFSPQNFRLLCKKAGLEEIHSSLAHYHAHMTALARKV